MRVSKSYRFCFDKLRTGAVLIKTANAPLNRSNLDKLKVALRWRNHGSDFIGQVVLIYHDNQEEVELYI